VHGAAAAEAHPEPCAPCAACKGRQCARKDGQPISVYICAELTQGPVHTVDVAARFTASWQAVRQRCLYEQELQHVKVGEGYSAWYVHLLWGCLPWSFSINCDLLASLGGDNHNVVLDRHNCGLDEALCAHQTMKDVHSMLVCQIH
jgi:hypothetical protein